MKPDYQPITQNTRSPSRMRVQYAALLGLLLLVPFVPSSGNSVSSAQHSRNLERCQSISTSAGPAADFKPVSRLAKASDRYVPGTPPTLIQNATIWTGDGELVKGDLLLDRGLIQAIGDIPTLVLRDLKKAHGELHTFNANGRWVTPGIVDLHSHIGVDSLPVLTGAMDTNSKKAPILPWLRSVDGLNTHDESYALALAGGVTTVQVLPGSAGNIGGQAFLIKLRPTAEKSTSSLLLEPPATLIPNQTSDHEHWRHMKHACGENPSRVYSQTRMDSSWNFRNAYDSARKLKVQQDDFCANVQAVEARRNSWLRWSSSPAATVTGDFPENLQWEALVDVLRGKVKLAIHCYEAVDLDMIIRLSNEFQFPIASIHHAQETYLVPDLLKKAWGGVPSIALFAVNSKKKREMYRASEFAPKILSDSGFSVVMKSDHPVLNSRYLLFEAQQAHYYGLDAEIALASITTHSAAAAGVGHRVGKAIPGYDADVVVWDSHPLAIGATPVQVWVDGIEQLKNPYPLSKPAKLQHPPVTPDWKNETQAAIDYNGLPPLRGDRSPIEKSTTLKFVGVKSVRVATQDGHISTLYHEEDKSGPGTSVVVHGGSISFCAQQDTTGPCNDQYAARVIDLKGGAIAPGLTTFGSRIGISEIFQEDSTGDGTVLDSLIAPSKVPAFLGETPIVRAVDGLQFEGRNILLAYRSGVTQAITAPYGTGFITGLSTTFETGAAHKLEPGAVVQTETALHVTTIYWTSVSVSTQIAALRRLLTESTETAWVKVREGEIPLVVNVASADIMATLITVKSEYEASTGNVLRLTFAGAEEAHLLAKEIAAANVSVILTSPRPFPRVWEQRRIIPGPPLSKDSGLVTLIAQGVNVAIGVVDDFYARNLRFDLSWALLESNGTISEEDAIALATTNLHRALGGKLGSSLVVYEGGTIFDFESKVAGVISLERGIYEEF